MSEIRNYLIMGWTSEIKIQRRVSVGSKIAKGNLEGMNYLI